MPHICKYYEIIEDIKRDMYGNGNAGIKMEVTILKNDMKWLKKIGIAIVILLVGNLTTMIVIFANLINRK